MDEWRSVSLGNLCDAGIATLQTGPFGSQLHAHDYVEEGIAVVPTEAIRDRQIDHAVLPKITPSKAQELDRHRLLVGDILFARRGVQATGHIGVVRAAEQDFLCGTGAIRLRIVPDNALVSPDFVSHVLANPESVEWFKFHAIGATMPNLNEGIIRAFSFGLPSLDQQSAIASILGTLDDKIDLNRRMNATLEAMARAVFKDWFVDFGPTRAKLEHRTPYLAPDLWALFPDRLDDDDMPEGWAWGTLGDMATLNPESWTRANYPPRIAYVDLSNTKWGVIESTQPHDRGGAPSRAQRVLRAGDTIVGTVRPGNGSYALVGAAGLTGSTGFAVLRPVRPACREFVYLAAAAPDNIERLSLLADGAAYPAVRPEIVLGTGAPVPGDRLIDAFHGLTAPLIERIIANHGESETLAATRDLLLPRLMSGELRVPAAERAVEAVL